MTRWDGLFADLEAQAQAWSAADTGAQVDDRARGEFADLRLVDRLRAACGRPLRVVLSGGLQVAGTLERVGPDWCQLGDDDRREVLVALGAVRQVAGLPRWSEPRGSEGAVGARLGIRSVLRAIARDRSPVRVHLTDGVVLDGTIDRVGADFVEAARHLPGEPRRRGQVHEVVALPLVALAALARDTSG